MPPFYEFIFSSCLRKLPCPAEDSGGGGQLDVTTLSQLMGRMIHGAGKANMSGQTVLQIEAVHNLRKVRMYLNVLSLRSTS